MKRQLGSDIYSAICPEAWDALARANSQGHDRPYGRDDWTIRAIDLLDERFGCGRNAWFVLSGTLANSLALAAGVKPYHAILCHDGAHIFTTECGGPEFFGCGARLIPLPGEHGKIDQTALEARLSQAVRVHNYRPRMLSLTQATECGTVYSLDELKALIDLAHGHGLLVHMDGARFANACVALGVTPREMSRQIGLDVLSLGGSKTGGAPSEVIVFFNESLAEEFAHRHKQAGQLASKMRYLSAPWVGMLENDAWLKHAKRANDLAGMLELRLRDLDVQIVHPRQMNMVFAKLEQATIDALAEKGWEYILPVAPGVYRLVTSWDNTQEDIDEFAADLRQVLGR